jgi:hypothetical protein
VVPPANVQAQPNLDQGTNRLSEATTTPPNTPAARAVTARTGTGQPPLVLTPIGEAGGGGAGNLEKNGSKVLSVVGLLALATGGSWGFFYFLKPKAKY